MISVVMSCPVQSCRVSLIGSSDSGTCAVAGCPSPSAARSAATPPSTVLVLVMVLVIVVPPRFHAIVDAHCHPAPSADQACPPRGGARLRQLRRPGRARDAADAIARPAPRGPSPCLIVMPGLKPDVTRLTFPQPIGR